MFLRPFFSYYGTKFRACRRGMYPACRYDLLIEPFAGSAAYALTRPHKQVRLYDLNEQVCAVWGYLFKVKESEIRGLPVDVRHIDEVQACQEAKWLMGYWFGRGMSTPLRKPSPWMKQCKDHTDVRFWNRTVRGTIASQLKYIRHWRVYCRSYETVSNKLATWFVDPPYQNFAGQTYKHKDVDYDRLGDWCRERKGQVIVCESAGADWLPFKPLRQVRGSANPNKKKKAYMEVIWQKGGVRTGFGLLGV